MRKLTKFFMAVVMLGAYACTTDTTKDLGANLGQGATEITISIEGSRTQLGSEADGLYPLYWSEGDQISVNGLPSNELTADEAGKASAKFSVQGLTAETYEIAYPAAEAGQVIFAKDQVHTNNATFGSGVSTMFAKCNAGEPVTLQHLTGVLKIGVTGSATLTHAQISTIDRAPIAGVFDFDFDNEFTTATEESEVVINYSFGEGVTLSSEPTYLHVAVPAGEYDELYVTLYDTEGGVLVATVKTDSNKPLVAGNIRTFKTDIAYEAKNDVKYFVIRDVATLKQFATKAAEGLAMDAVLVADIDLAGEAWASIEGGGFSGTVLGNGYSIKGLTAPLFNTTSASFKGLHLEGVAINETANPNVGAFARAIVATDTVKPTFTNCSANGTITVNCTEYTLAEGADTARSFAIGGFAGYTQGVDFTECTNSINIDVDQVVNSENNTVIYPSVAGFVGLLNHHTNADETKKLSNMWKCENNGSIDVYVPSCGSGNQYENKVVCYVAGLVGYTKSGNAECDMEDLTNRGNITFSGNVGQGLFDEENVDAVNNKDIDSCLAGVVGYLATTGGLNFTNYGAVSYNNGNARFHYIGGVVGMLGKNCVLDNADNHGDVTVGVGDGKLRIASLHCGGVVGYTLDDSTLKNSDNYNPVSANYKTVGPGSTGKHRYYRVGGIVAFANGDINNCNNHTHATITCQGTNDGIPEWKDACIGGIVAYSQSPALDNCTNDAELNVDLTLSKIISIDHSRLNLGGVVGLSSQPLNDVHNNGNINVAGSYCRLSLGGVIGDMNYGGTKEGKAGYYNNGAITIDGATLGYISYIGGCVGFTKGAVTTLENGTDGTISIKGVTATASQSVTTKAEDGTEKTTTYNNYTNIGGCVGYCEATTGVVSSATNSGAITLSDETTINRWAIVGGVVGYSFGNLSTITNNQSGAIAINDVTLGYINLFGGCVGKAEAGANGKITGATNHAPITLSTDATINQSSYVGGCVALTNNALETIENKSTGVIKIEAAITTTDKNHFHGGCVGRSQEASGTITTATNRGSVTTKTALGGGTLYLGGVVGEITAAVTTANNHGAITVAGSHTGTSYIGGISGKTTAAVTTANNYGTIDVSSNVDGGKRYIAGIAPQLYGGGTGLTNHATGDITTNLQKGSNTYVSGICGFAQANCSTLLNQGDITINGSITALTLIGGVFSDASYDNLTLTNIKNEGNIVANGTFSGDTRFSGLQSDTNKIQTWVDSYNKGNITIKEGSSFSGAKELRIAGLLAYTRTADKTNTLNKCYNTGHITVEKGVSITNLAYIGGLIGQVANYAPVVEGYLYNTGNVKVLHDAAEGVNLYVGGAVGTIGLAISNMQSLCDVVAMPKAGGVGMITGTSRPSSAWASSCMLGGRIAKELDENGEPVWKTISAGIVYGEYDPDADDTPRNPDYIPYWEAIYSNIQNETDNCSYIDAVVTE